jgi:hypothetical protein
MDSRLQLSALLAPNLANALLFYQARCSMTAKYLLNGSIRLICDRTDANGICFFKEQLIHSYP